MPIVSGGGGGGAGAGGAFSLICDSTLSGTQASFDTNTILGGGIAATFNHLMVVALLRETSATIRDYALLQFNNDAAANYNSQELFQTGNTPTGAGQFGGSGIKLGILGASATAAKFAGNTVTIPAYTQTVAQKIAYGTYALDAANTSANFEEGALAGTWKNTAAITRIVIAPTSGSLDIGSRFTLYGLT